MPEPTLGTTEKRAAVHVQELFRIYFDQVFVQALNLKTALACHRSFIRFKTPVVTSSQIGSYFWFKGTCYTILSLENRPKSSRCEHCSAVQEIGPQ
jgi:hypothetical protein